MPSGCVANCPNRCRRDGAKYEPLLPQKDPQKRAKTKNADSAHANRGPAGWPAACAPERAPRNIRAKFETSFMRQHQYALLYVYIKIGS